MTETPHKLSIAQIRRRLEQSPADEHVFSFYSDDPRKGVQHLLRMFRHRHQAQQKEEERLRSMLTFEKSLWDLGVEYVAGVDEAGAGPLAGPVYAAAVILRPHTSLPGINDSKKLTSRERQALLPIIKERAVAYAVGIVEAQEIDAVNIFQASRLAMARAVANLSINPQHLLIDARVIPHTHIRQTKIIKGDTLSQSIAAASVVAKEERDALMRQLSQIYPDYGFDSHMGYGTAKHLLALKRLGPTPIHRLSFAPVAHVAKGAR